MASNSSISSAPSSNSSSYPPNTGVSRSGNSATSVTSLYDDRKQANRSAVVQALADPAAVELLERTAWACKVQRNRNNTCWYAPTILIFNGVSLSRR
ncbi:hypothetical protein DM02DRAFT_216410 [Periconia macrospinosa]|uniref:Uncharacterized protein n=1 Tax=Periconia macrospinosa TaxID=97972 RepID=A0A2V1D6F5_9PLEO|nr:hypothetical protein DM02DRAFT_216410 [Periconia macrospinosa]